MEDEGLAAEGVAEERSALREAINKDQLLATSTDSNNNTAATAGRCWSRPHRRYPLRLHRCAAAAACHWWVWLAG